MVVALHGREFNEKKAPYIQEVFDQLATYARKVLVSTDFLEHIRHAGIMYYEVDTYTKETDLSGIDFFISLGGDGTLLETVARVGASGTPILGINTGRMGFLATTQKTEIAQAIESLSNNFFTYEERSLLKLESDRELFESPYALNEFAILKTDTSSMIVVHTYIDGEYLNSYWADGLIVATPTGSTGYSLSCGGPVVLPKSNNLIITPVSPHNLNVRPLVVSDSSIISFEVEGRSNNFLAALDYRSCTIDNKVQLAVRKESFKVKLVKFNGYNFLDTLRQKLNWGLDLRN